MSPTTLHARQVLKSDDYRLEVSSLHVYICEFSSYDDDDSLFYINEKGFGRKRRHALSSLFPTTYLI